MSMIEAVRNELANNGGNGDGQDLPLPNEISKCDKN